MLFQPLCDLAIVCYFHKKNYCFHKNNFEAYATLALYCGCLLWCTKVNSIRHVSIYVRQRLFLQGFSLVIAVFFCYFSLPLKDKFDLITITEF